MAAAEVRSALAAPPRRRPAAVARDEETHAGARAATAGPLVVLLFASGLTALVYEVLWLKQLALLLGSTSRSAAVTLSVFFLGLSLGSEYFGRRAARSARPLRAYAALELGVAAAALAYFFLFDAWVAVYAQLFQSLRGWAGGALALKLALSVALLLPASFLMGGTLPLFAEHVARRGGDVGRTGSLLYAVNTAGGALGALLAGFWLPPLLGYDASYLAAIAVNLAVALVALPVASHTGELATPLAAPDAAAAARERPGSRALSGTQGERSAEPLSGNARLALAGLSGFVALALEVLWTRMFAQVLHNSVYSFASILVTFLVALAVGAALARAMLSRSSTPTGGALRSAVAPLAWMLTASGLAIGLSPFVFYAATSGLQYVSAKEGWLGYLGIVFGLAAGAIGIPALLLGTVFPLVLGLAPKGESAGRAIGRLAAANTLGAIAGSLAAAFVMLEWLGLWASIRTLAVLYPITALLLASRLDGASRALRTAPLVAILALVTVADASRLPRLPDLQHLKQPPAIHRIWEGSDGTVAVVSVGGHLRTVVDNYYSLGGSDERQYEETQADLPLLLHPRPRSVFFLGLGTGITAGAALRHPVERLVAAELSPEVAEASEQYFGAFTNGLFTDPRAEVVVEDGRQYLLATDERFDVIVSDLFIPWQAGAGSLYSKEHFAAVRQRLAPGGLFAQWLPLYQLSKDEVQSIARTFVEVFPQATLWRGDFLAERPIVALVGQNAAEPLDPEALVENYRRLRGSPEIGRESVLALLGMFYAGNLGAARESFEAYPVNTDDRPVIEYRSPVTHREQRAGRASWLVGADLVGWFDELHARAPLAGDPYLARLAPREVGFAEAGLLLLRARASAGDGDRPHAIGYFEEFRRLVPPEIAARFEKAAASRESNTARRSTK
jgi:spermidine synthase